MFDNAVTIGEIQDIFVEYLKTVLIGYSIYVASETQNARPADKYANILIKDIVFITVWYMSYIFFSACLIMIFI